MEGMRGMMDTLSQAMSMEHEEPEEHSRSKSFFLKDASGQWWFFGIYSNKFKDKDGEIISSEAHKEYVSWLKETGFKPMLTVYHLPRMPQGFWVKVFDRYEDNVPVLQKIVDTVYGKFGFARAEHVNYVNGFMTVAGRVLPGKEGIAEKLADVPEMGMSHGFIVKESSANIFDRLRTFEMTTLRNRRAANVLTVSRVVRQEGELMNKGEKGFDPEDRSVLVSVFGEDAISHMEMDTEKAEKILSEVVEYKDALMDTEVEAAQEVETPASEAPADAPEAEVEAAAETPETEEKSTPALTVEVLAAGLDQTFKELQAVLTEMQKELGALRQENEQFRKELTETRTEVKEVKQSEDEKVAAMWSPVLNWRAGYSASASTDNLVENKEEKKELTENAPEGEQAKSGADMTNPLYALAWSHILGNG